MKVGLKVNGLRKARAKIVTYRKQSTNVRAFLGEQPMRNGFRPVCLKAERIPPLATGITPGILNLRYNESELWDVRCVSKPWDLVLPV